MEQIIIQILSILIQSTVSTYFFITLSSNLSKERLTKKTYFYTFLSITALITISNIINLKQYNPMLNTLFIAFIHILITKFILKVQLLKSVIIVFLYYIILALTEILNYFALNKIFNISADNLSTISYEFLIFIMMQNLLIAILLTIFNMFSKNKHTANNILEVLSFKNIKLLLFMIIGYILPQILLFTFNSYEYPLPLLIISSIQIILVSILIFLYFKDIIKKEQAELDLKNSEIHNKTLTETVDGIRKLKHDYGNIVQALNGYVVTKNYDKMHEYVNSLIKEFGDINNISLISPKIFNEPAIYGVVGAKYFTASEDNIPFEIEVTSNIKEINFSKPELSRIFGILLDNAIEATRKANEKFIRLEIHHNTKKGADIIRIINSFDTSNTPDLDKIYDKGVSSKKEKSGIGLWEVKKMVNKNSHTQIYATIEGDKFVQNLIIEE